MGGQCRNPRGPLQWRPLNQGQQSIVTLKSVHRLQKGWPSGRAQLLTVRD